MKLSIIAVLTALALGSTQIAFAENKTSEVSVFDGSTEEENIDPKVAQKEQEQALKDLHNKVKQDRLKPKSYEKAVIDKDSDDILFTLNLQDYFGIEMPVKEDGDADIDSFIANGGIGKFVENSAPIKTGDFYAAQSKKNKKMAFFSQNGRYIMIGDMYDVYSGMRKIESVDDIRKIANRIRFDKYGIDYEKLNSVKIGTGPKKVGIFVSPTSQYTKDIISKALAVNKVTNEGYTFYFIVMATKDDEIELVNNFFCAREKGNTQIGNLLYKNELKTLEKGTCDLKQLALTYSAAKIAQVDMVPFVIAPDGRISRGIPSDGLQNFLETDLDALIEQEQKSKIDLTDPEQVALKKRLEKQITEKALRDDAIMHNKEIGAPEPEFPAFDKENEQDVEMRRTAAQKEINFAKQNYKIEKEKVENLERSVKYHHELAQERIRNSLNSLVNNKKKPTNYEELYQNYQDKLAADQKKQDEELKAVTDRKNKAINKYKEQLTNIQTKFDIDLNNEISQIEEVKE